MTPEQEQFAVELSDRAPSHKEWLCIVRFGLKSLLDCPPVLIEIIWREAARQVERKGSPIGRVASDEAREIFDELGLKVVMA